MYVDVMTKGKGRGKKGKSKREKDATDSQSDRACFHCQKKTHYKGTAKPKRVNIVTTQRATAQA